MGNAFDMLLAYILQGGHAETITELYDAEADVSSDSAAEANGAKA